MTISNYNGTGIEAWRVVVEGDDYLRCEQSSHNMWANKKKGLWGKGYKNTSDDPRKVERSGRLGEMAFTNLTGSPIDLSYIEGGDRQDTVFRKKTVNIKVAFALYGVIMVRCEMNGRQLTLHEDMYVFSYLSNDDREKKSATIDFLGCLLKPELLSKPRVSRKEWVNYECPYSELHPMRQLLSIPEL